jgi:integrase
MTGMRRGELVGVRRSGLVRAKHRITVDSAVAASGKVKTTKTRRERTFHVDSETMTMLKLHCDHLEERARAAGVQLRADPFLFSLSPDGSTPMPPDHFTKRAGVLKGHLGIEDKRSDVVALEDQALRLRRQPPGRQ